MTKYSVGIPEKSEVMEEFLRIAKEQGLYDVNNLYDIDTGEDLTGKELIERAHPKEDSVELESYIENAGLVEDATQQQEVGIEIALKMPDNKVSRKTLASENLKEELSIIADEMSLRGERGLEKIAKEIQNNLIKEALAPLAIGALIAVPTIIGAYLAAIHWTDPVDYGIDTNLKSLFWAIEDYRNDVINKSYEQDTYGNMAVFLDRLRSLILQIDRTRKAYMKAARYLATAMQAAPQSKEDVKNITAESVKKTMEDERSKRAAEILNRITEKYNNYIRSVMPELQKTSKMLGTSFENLDVVQDETGQRSTSDQLYEKTKSVVEMFYKKPEEHLLDALQMVITSLERDITARAQETEHAINTLSNPIKTEIEKEFAIEDVEKELTEETK